MYVEPKEPETKATIKADPTGPARSTIRRQRTVRYTPHAQESSSVERRRRRLEALHELASEAANDTTQLRVPYSSIHERNEHELDMVEADLVHAEAANRRQQESGRALLRDALSYEHPGRRMRIPQRNSSLRSDVYVPLPPAPISRSRSPLTLPRLPVSLDRSPPPSRNIEFPPPPGYVLPHYTVREGVSRSPPPAIEPVASITTSPYAYVPEYWHSEQEMRRALRRMRPSTRTTALPVIEAGVAHQPDNQEQATSRHRHETNALSPVDGLGDRRRSFSPEDNAAWDTLLTTITPDERLPSASSSFTSATASAASFGSSARSSTTNLTMPSTSAEYLTICDENSDLELSSSNEESDDQVQPSNHPPATTDTIAEPDQTSFTDRLAEIQVRRALQRRRLRHAERETAQVLRVRQLERDRTSEQSRRDVERLRTITAAHVERHSASRQRERGRL